MKAGEASSTAKVIAASTILLDSDPRTRQLVAPGAAALCRRFLSTSTADRWLARSAAYPPTRAICRWLERLTHPGIMAHYWHRKRWIEMRCRAALEEGFERVMIVGAGFDTLGYRLAAQFPNVEVVEIDHPATQRPKAATLVGDEALARGNLRFLALDLGLEPFPTSLAMARESAFVIIEGVLMYLGSDDIDRLFDLIQRMSASRLRIVFSFMTRWADGSAGFRPRSWLIERWLAWRGEPFLWAIEPQNVSAFLSERGFKLVELAVTREFSAGASALDGENLVSCEPAMRSGRPGQLLTVGDERSRM